jgi:hypothetical protein
MLFKSATTLTAALMFALVAPAAANAQSNPHRTDDREQTQRPAPQQQQAAPQRQPAQQQRPNTNSRQPNYGNWNNSWGARPPAPPRHWTRSGDWYRHVRACQQRYRSYSARTDTYRTNSGRTVRCTL